jgi:hypothetical protein
MLPINQPEEFKTLLIKEQIVLVNWVRTHLTPRKTINKRYSSYGLKHYFEEDKQHGGFYVTNGTFKGAMLFCGYVPDFWNDTNWCFGISNRSKAFMETHKL